MRCSELRKRLREPKSVVSVGRLVHDLTTRQAKKFRLILTGAWLTCNLYGWPRVNKGLNIKKSLNCNLTMLKTIL